MRQSNLKFLSIALAISAYTPSIAQTCEELANIDNYPDEFKNHFPVITVGNWFISSNELEITTPPSEESQSLLSDFASRLEENGTHLGMLIGPPRVAYLPRNLAMELPKPNQQSEMQRAYQNYILTLQKTGIVAPDLSIGQFPEGKNYYFAQDNHWTADGAFWSAIEIRNGFEARGLTVGDLGAHFSMQEIGVKQNTGSYAKIVAAVCDDDTPEIESATKYDYTLNSTDNTEAALFGDADQSSKAVAVGTSFLSGPADHFNAGGALSYALDSDVMNRGIISGALDTSMIDFLSQTPATDFPEFLIWEFPFSNGTDDRLRSALRQFIGLMADQCDPDGVFTQSEEITLSQDGSANLLIPLALEDIVEIHAPGLGFGDITIGYRTVDGMASSMAIHRSDRLPDESQVDRWVTYIGDPAAADGKGSVITLTDIKVAGNTQPETITLRMCSSKLH